jgi:hypothetical protein
LKTRPRSVTVSPAPIVFDVEEEPETVPAVYVIGDVHGHRAELACALHDAGLITPDKKWCGATANVWFLGDFFDRGPNGLGVVDLVMNLSTQAADAGGSVRALLGNHEVLTLGMHRFGDREVSADVSPRSFARSWHLNGGLAADQAALTDRHIQWLATCPALALADDHLLMHSDTVEYLAWGTSIDEINESVAAVLAGDDIVKWWECWRKLTTRYAFRGPAGVGMAAKILAILGGSRIVHGHSVIADQLGVTPSQVDGPLVYADGRVIGVDGGVFVGGPCLVVRLPLADKATAATG